MLMSETLSNLPLSEILNPRNTPELGFQSYEMLAGDGDYRLEQQNAFLAGEIKNPELDYPKLDAVALRSGISSLHDVLSRVQSEPDMDVREIVWDSTSYRMAEMYWLLSVDDMMTKRQLLQPEQVEAKARYVQELNEQLYGKPEAVITDKILGEAWAQIDAKELTDETQKLKSELENGVTVNLGDDVEVFVRPLKKVQDKRLPIRTEDMLSVLKEKLLQDNQDIVELVTSYWHEVVQQRPETDRHFTPQDMYEVFDSVLKLRDPHEETGVKVIMDPDATALSWETPLFAVKIGGRRDPISDPETMLAKVFHEFVVHGGRAINGSQTTIPVLGTGLFTEAGEGEVSDYLTFEEGLASTCEASISTEKDSWKPLDLEKSLGLALAYEGRDFREVFETLWRVRILMITKSGSSPTDKGIATAKNNAYTSTLRIFRGTPTTMDRIDSKGEPLVLTYNKDLAYLNGKVLMLDFWNQYKNDPEMLDMIFKYKIDPMNKRQREIAESMYRKTNS